VPLLITPSQEASGVQRLTTTSSFYCGKRAEKKDGLARPFFV
jgi:hypothetical protein